MTVRSDACGGDARVAREFALGTLGKLMECANERVEDRSGWEITVLVGCRRGYLKGLKENIIIGHLIPAGTGVHRYQDVEFMVEQAFYEEAILPLSDPDDLGVGLGVEVDAEKVTAD